MSLDPICLEALKALRRLWPDRRCVLIGATALEVRLGLRWRKTEDLDLAWELTPEELSGGMATLSGWSRQSEQRWRSPEGVSVDIIPADPDLIAAGEIFWPDSEARMSLVGFEHAFDESPEVSLAEGFALPVAPVAVLALLKMTSYLDRPAERGKDLEDLVYILTEYIGPEDPRRYSDVVFEADLTYEQVSAFLLGRQMRKFAAPNDQTVIQRFIVRSRDAGDPYGTRARMADALPPTGGDKEEELLVLIEVFERGLSR